MLEQCACWLYHLWLPVVVALRVAANMTVQALDDARTHAGAGHLCAPATTASTKIDRTACQTYVQQVHASPCCASLNGRFCRALLGNHKWFRRDNICKQHTESLLQGCVRTVAVNLNVDKLSLALQRALIAQQTCRTCVDTPPLSFPGVRES